MWSTALRSARSHVVRPLLAEQACVRPSSAIASSHQRFFSISAVSRQDEAKPAPSLESLSLSDDEPAASSPAPSAFAMPTLLASESLPESFRAAQAPSARPSPSSSDPSPFTRASFGQSQRVSMHRLHVHATRNNIIMTLTTAEGDVIQRTSSGQLGFRNAARSTYDAAYRVAMFMFERIEQNRVAWRLAKMEVIWNGFGQGRDAVYRALMSNEGALVRNLIRRTADNTAIKVGGTRPKKKRML